MPTPFFTQDDLEKLKAMNVLGGLPYPDTPVLAGTGTSTGLPAISSAGAQALQNEPAKAPAAPFTAFTPQPGTGGDFYGSRQLGSTEFTRSGPSAYMARPLGAAAHEERMAGTVRAPDALRGIPGSGSSLPAPSIIMSHPKVGPEPTPEPTATAPKAPAPGSNEAVTTQLEAIATNAEDTYDAAREQNVTAIKLGDKPPNTPAQMRSLRRDVYSAKLALAEEQRKVAKEKSETGKADLAAKAEQTKEEQSKTYGDAQLTILQSANPMGDFAKIAKNPGLAPMDRSRLRELATAMGTYQKGAAKAASDADAAKGMAGWTTKVTSGFKAITDRAAKGKLTPEQHVGIINSLEDAYVAATKAAGEQLGPDGQAAVRQAYKDALGVLMVLEPKSTWRDVSQEGIAKMRELLAGKPVKAIAKDKDAILAELYKWAYEDGIGDVEAQRRLQDYLAIKSQLSSTLKDTVSGMSGPVKKLADMFGVTTEGE